MRRLSSSCSTQDHIYTKKYSILIVHRERLITNKPVLVIGIAILIGISGCKSNPVQTGGGNLSSSYSFKSGHGTIHWDPMVWDHNNYVARDWNGDGKSDVLALTSIYGSLPNGATSYHQPYALIADNREVQ